MPAKSRRKNKPASRGWKVIQSKRQKIKRTKLAVIVFAAILSLLLLSQAVKFTQMLINPWKELPSHKKTVLWNGDFNMNIVIAAKQVSLLSFNPKERTATIIEVPQNSYLDTSFGFGKWLLSSIYELGESQKDVGGAKLLKKSLENLFGIPIDGVLYFSDKYAKQDISVIVSEIKKTPFSVVSLLPYLKTNLTPFELIKLNWGLSGVRFDKIKHISLEEVPDLLLKDKLLDGTEIVTLDTIKLDSVLTPLTDSILKNEHKTIAIFNSTSHPGLAQKAARLITNIGGDVIITTNGQSQIKKTQIFGEKSKTLERLKQIFEADDIIDLKDGDLVSSRAQINLFLGEDYFEQL